MPEIMTDARLGEILNLEWAHVDKADTKMPKPTRSNEWWGIDMTKVMIEGFGRVYVVVGLDW